MEKKTFLKKAGRELLLFLGYQSKINPLDSEYWRPNYDLFSNISNPFDEYQFTVEENGVTRIESVSLAELCLFQQDTFITAKNRIRNILEEISTGPGAIVSLEDYDNTIPSSAYPAWREPDPRWNNPTQWFTFPHTTDVYSPNADLPRGIPIPKVGRFVGYKPTSNLFNREVFSDQAFHSLAGRLIDCLNDICIASNIKPSFFSLAFTSNSPGNNSVDYANMDRIARGVATSSRQRFVDAGIYDIDDIIRNPRALWAHPVDGDMRDFRLVTETYSNITRIPLDGSQARQFMAYSTGFGSLFNVPFADSSGQNCRIKSIQEIGGDANHAFSGALSIRSPNATNYSGYRIYCDPIGNFLALVNICSLIKNHPPQVFLHTGMSLHNSLLELSFSQLGGALNDSEGSYKHLWGQEVAARASLPPGEDGYNVAFSPDITWENIGTMAIYAGQRGVQSGNGWAAVIAAAGALIREMETPQFGNILARAPALENIRQDGSKTLNSTIYRNFTPRRVISSNPIIRLPS